MFQDLDLTIEKLLHDSQAPAELKGAEVIFETPIKNYGTRTRADINLFLYEVKENRELRQTAPLRNGQGAIRRAPLRVDCSYLVTTWSEDDQKKQEVFYEHMLLGKTLAWLSSFPTIPETHLTGELSRQIYAPPTMVAQLDGGRNMGEFWSALGIPPRPYFNLIVTICMDLDQQIEAPIVTTITSRYLQTDEPSSAEELLLIGGTVRDKDRNPIPDAWVRLEPLNSVQASEIKVTDQSGRFIFSHAARGSGFTLQARASGYPKTLEQSFDVVPSASGDYDLQFP